MVFLTQSSTRGYIRTEGDFHKEIIVERTNKAEITLEEQSEKLKVVRRMFGIKHS